MLNAKIDKNLILNGRSHWNRRRIRFGNNYQVYQRNRFGKRFNRGEMFRNHSYYNTFNKDGYNWIKNEQRDDEKEENEEREYWEEEDNDDDGGEKFV